MPQKDGLPLVAQAKCQFEDGTTRTLPIKRLTLIDVSLAAMILPPIGTILSVQVLPGHAPAITPIQGRVFAATLDPFEPQQSGFEVVFTETAEKAFKALEIVSDHQEFKIAPKAERRLFPRLATDLVSTIEYGGKEYQGRLSNLSLPGAFFILPSRELSGVIPPGTRLVINIINTDIPEHVSVNAEVVRIVENPDSVGYGIKFVLMNEVSLKRIEGLLIKLLWNVSTG